MRKIIFITALALLANNTGICQYAFVHCYFYKPQGAIKNNLKENHLFGKVKTITINTYKLNENFGNPQKGDKTFEETNDYDSKGNITETYMYIKRYNHKTKKDELIKTLKVKNVYQYDKTGNVLEIKQYNTNGSLNFTYDYIYDDIGNLIEETDQSPNRQDYHCKITYTKNDKGNIVGIKQYTSAALGLFQATGDSASFITICKYDDSGNLIECCVKDNEHQGDLKMIFKYDVNKNLTENTNGRSDSATYMYDNYGNLTENRYDDSKLEKTFKYNNFDKQHNWISMVEDDSKALIQKGVETPQKLTERTIEYYQ